MENLTLSIKEFGGYLEFKWKFVSWDVPDEDSALIDLTALQADIEDALLQEIETWVKNGKPAFEDYFVIREGSQCFPKPEFC